MLSITGGTNTQRAMVRRTLTKFGEATLERMREAGGKIYILAKGQKYAEASPELSRLGIDVDAWPAPPAGLFVVVERTVYIRTCCAMTIAHECGHLLDCTLGNGIYFSGTSAEIRNAFINARSFVTPYAATGIDEYFAEATRAWVEANTKTSHWPPATRERLQRIDPTMYAIVENIFAGACAEVAA